MVKELWWVVKGLAWDLVGIIARRCQSKEDRIRDREIYDSNTKKIEMLFYNYDKAKAQRECRRGIDALANHIVKNYPLDCGRHVENLGRVSKAVEQWTM